MKPIHIILTVLIVACISSIIYAQQQRSEALNYQMQVTELQTTVEQQEMEAYALKDKAQMAAADARMAMNMAEEQARNAVEQVRNAEEKISELEKTLKNCKVGR